MDGERWRCGGLSWGRGAPELRWARGTETRTSRLAHAQEIAFRAAGVRRCAGARGHVCPLGAAVPGRSTGGQCPECARLDRAHSVAADTVADDPRPFRVYLAWFGPGLVKVGITAEERGTARLLEQGAVVFCWLGRGPLMAARRTEELLRAALGVPDRIPYARKRAVRPALPAAADERAAEVVELYARAVELPGWPEALERTALEVVDHVRVFGLDRALPPGPAGGGPSALRVVRELVDGGCVAGRLVAAAGPDLLLGGHDGRMTVLDTRLLSGWELVAADPRTAPTVPVEELPTGVQDGLF
ncbi:DUF2797 domain-containing protein [Streptomyces tirandamycinicus]|uniref:DUF2797 domain-containing protein n=1 Tax=Streptomyces tirandamycinicus TaxID=2174846 RepID=UPI00226FDEA8|nr:DUF2797 domain-containing protein [Streptomyces tirandamycinicus]MCY0982385.1 DUF2797 domain-containing protein [Streptomyces tirandamycinicus]